MEDNTKSPEAAVDNTAASNEEQKTPANVLLGSVSYSNLDDYNKFLENMDINQSLFVLISGCTFAQTKGAFTLEEAELISKAIKTIKNQAQPPAKEEAPNEPQSETVEAPAT